MPARGLGEQKVTVEVISQRGHWAVTKQSGLGVTVL